jgi:hypothetical protein
LARRTEDAALEEAQEAVIQEGGIIHEDAMWDIAEMALDGANQKSMVDRLKKARAEPYKPKGGRTPPRG